MENSVDATDTKISEECQPGKPITVFSSTALKVEGRGAIVQREAESGGRYGRRDK